MDEQKKTAEENQGEFLDIDLIKIYKQLKSSWKRIGIWCFIAFAISLVIAFSIPPKYSVTTELAPELSSSTSRLGSITSMLGMSSIAGGSDAIYPSLYPQLKESTPFMVNLLTSNVTIEDEEDHHTEVVSVRTYMKEHMRKPWWGTAIKWVGDLFSSEKESARDTIDPYHLTESETRLIEKLSKLVDVEIDNKTMGITISAKAQNAHVAADMCNTVTSLLQQSVADYRTNKAKQDLAYYQTLYEEAKAEYHQAQSNYAHYVDSHQGVVLLSVKVEQDRLQNEKNLKYQLYNSIASELQHAKAKVQQETPVFAVVVPATIPVKPSSPQKKIIAAVFLFLGFVGGSLDVLYWHKKEEDTDEAPAKA